jgi:hypothetical protein
MGLSYGWVHKPRAVPGIHGAYLISGMVWTLVAIGCLAHYFGTWWAIEDAGLMQHRLWETRTIPWDEITRVGPWEPNNKPLSKWLAVGYRRSAPMSDSGEMVLQPADRESLVRTLRAHAPLADFDLPPFDV